MSLTAQSLLVAVGVSNAERLVRALALLLATVFGLLSMQLMGKQRLHEQVDTRYLHDWEHAAGITPVKGFAPHDRAAPPWPDKRPGPGPSKAEVLRVRTTRFVRLSSYTCWTWGLRFFLLATLGLLIWVLAVG